ncbi:hypothetical protein JCM11491_005461 [Sporobolomyces phaffii]
MRLLSISLAAASALTTIHAAALSITTEASVKVGSAIKFQWSGGSSPYSLKIFIDDSVVASNDGWQSRSVQWRASGDRVPVGSKIKIRVTDRDGDTVVSDETTVVDRKSPDAKEKDKEKRPAAKEEAYDGHRGEYDHEDKYSDEYTSEGRGDDDVEVTPNDGSKEMMSDPNGGGQAGGGRDGKPFAPTPTGGARESGSEEEDGIMSIQTVPNPELAAESGTDGVFTLESAIDILTDSEPTATLAGLAGGISSSGAAAPTLVAGSSLGSATPTMTGGSGAISSSTPTSSVDADSTASAGSASSSSSSPSPSSADSGGSNTMTYVVVGVVLLVILAAALGGIYWWKKRQAKVAADQAGSTKKSKGKKNKAIDSSDSEDRDEESLVGTRAPAVTNSRSGGAYDSEDDEGAYRDGDGVDYTDSEPEHDRSNKPTPKRTR